VCVLAAPAGDCVELSPFCWWLVGVRGPGRMLASPRQQQSGGVWWQANKAQEP
jgi:hypothetical protein